MLYEIKFTDGTEFKGGNLKDTKWNQIPDKPIYSLTYYFFGKAITLTEYESYNHIWEKAQNLFNGQEILCDIYLMARTEGQTIVIHFNLIKETTDVSGFSYDKELRGKAVSGWKKGIENGKPKITGI